MMIWTDVMLQSPKSSSETRRATRVRGVATVASNPQEFV